MDMDFRRGRSVLDCLSGRNDQIDRGFVDILLLRRGVGLGEELWMLGQRVDGLKHSLGTGVGFPPQLSLDDTQSGLEPGFIRVLGFVQAVIGF